MTVAALAAGLAGCAALSFFPRTSAFHLVQTDEVAYGKVLRYENADGEGYALALDSAGRPLSSTPYRAAEHSSEGSPAFAVEKEQTDYYDDRVSVTTDFEDGVYTLADPLRNIYVYHARNGTGQFPTDDMRYRNETGVFDDPIAITSYLNLIRVYDFYANGGAGKPLRGVDGSHDEIAGNAEENHESLIYLFIHYGVNEQNAHGWFDKYYNASMLGMGDGVADGVLYKLGRAVDVMAHEYQHSITHFSVDFVGRNESGAIDEAISDIFGALAEGHDLTDERFWQMGEDAAVKEGGYVRSIKDPSDEYASSFDDPFPLCYETHNHANENCDFGGIHYNSTILTHAQYLMVQDMPEFFTKKRIGELWFSLIPLLGEEATFEDFKGAFVQTAENLGYGQDALNVIRRRLGLREQFTVSFRNYDGSELYSAEIGSGEDAVYRGETPVMPATEQYEYTFDGWDNPLGNITQNTVFTATYKSTLRSYPIKYYSRGLLYREETLSYGDEIPLPVPERKGYTFGGWYLDDSLTERAEGQTVNGELHLYAKWEKAPALSRTLVIILSVCGALLGVGLLSLPFLIKKRR